MDVDDSNSVSQMKRYRSEPFLFKNPNPPNLRKQHSFQQDEDSQSPFPLNRPQLLGRRFRTSQTINKIPSRLNQIKLEETIDKSDIETAHEREVQSSLCINQSWDDFSLEDSESMLIDSMLGGGSGGKKTPTSSSSQEPLLISTNCFLSNHQMSTQSPTRVGKQCYSPSLQQPIKDNSFISTSPHWSV
ncbi:hypothetical protein HELRODRAFT_176447 [Helobdella robusta]|uniref:Protein aurora borealis n=1 Tax=Helobdella robusta TaxID=6412 RepID=T1FAI3_HELRO|nr:hypothetical protein HELRODRAFT_176447 [Helobdella robusta]ESN99687.1 hypothetical protein HELRODRAFT_176447 [Helobdella robusta]